MGPSKARQRAALNAIEAIAREPGGSSNLAVAATIREKLGPRGIPRGYSFETIRKARLSGTVGHELLAALLRYFDCDEDHEEPFMRRFGAPAVSSAAHLHVVTAKKAVKAARSANDHAHAGVERKPKGPRPSDR